MGATDGGAEDNPLIAGAIVTVVLTVEVSATTIFPEKKASSKR